MGLKASRPWVRHSRCRPTTDRRRERCRPRRRAARRYLSGGRRPSGARTSVHAGAAGLSRDPRRGHAPRVSELAREQRLVGPFVSRSGRADLRPMNSDHEPARPIAVARQRSSAIVANAASNSGGAGVLARSHRSRGGARLGSRPAHGLVTAATPTAVAVTSIIAPPRTRSAVVDGLERIVSRRSEARGCGEDPGVEVEHPIHGTPRTCSKVAVLIRTRGRDAIDPSASPGPPRAVVAEAMLGAWMGGLTLGARRRRGRCRRPRLFSPVLSDVPLRLGRRVGAHGVIAIVRGSPPVARRRRELPQGQAFRCSSASGYTGVGLPRPPRPGPEPRRGRAVRPRGRPGTGRS